LGSGLSESGVLKMLRKEVSLNTVSHYIKKISLEMIENACSGHPGLPLGCSALVAYMYKYIIRYSSQNPNHPLRDRFILSAGHGSALLYAILHLTRKKHGATHFTKDDLATFRQYKSRTPGHPELDPEYGVESTTGPLGQGVAHGVGQALALQKIYGDQAPRVFVLAGDGCILEGINHEACALAGHWGLSNLVLLYDSNDVTLDGPLSMCSSEDTAKRYEAYGWDVIEIDAHNEHELHEIQKHLSNTKRPLLIIAKTIIGHGSKKYAGTSRAHGSPLGREETNEMLVNMEVRIDPFDVPSEIYDYFDGHQQIDDETAQCSSALNEKKFETGINLNNVDKTSGRSLSHAIMNQLSQYGWPLYVGSADLSCSDKTYLKRDEYSGDTLDNIAYGPREFAMAAIASGIAQVGHHIPVVGTFLVFSDYMKNAIRLNQMMGLHTIYHFTHDSIMLGEDGPTHQPIEHLAQLRAIPGLSVFRPSTKEEFIKAWTTSVTDHSCAHVIISSRHEYCVSFDDVDYEHIDKGAYVFYGDLEQCDLRVYTSGSDLISVYEAAKKLKYEGVQLCIISVLNWNQFRSQENEYVEYITKVRPSASVSVESACSFGWSYFTKNHNHIGPESFGISAPKKDIENHFKMSVDQMVNQFRGLIEKR
jgi:transketolase